MEERPSTSGGLKRSVPHELQEKIDVIAAKVPRVTAKPSDLDHNQKSWLIVGICLHSIISPALRKYVVPILTLLYNELTLNYMIDTQTYSTHLKQYPATNAYLIYEAVNNNKAKFGYQKAKYDYTIKSVVDLSKLFLPPHMAQYTGFDDTCDSSALLGLIINIDKFPVAVKSDADNVRRNIRNTWAHCDFTEWDAVKYADSFQLMENLVKNLCLSSSTEELHIKGNMEKWKISGQQFLGGTTLGLELVNDIRQHTHVLAEYTKLVAIETDENCMRIKNVLESFDIILNRLTQLEKDVETRISEINERLVAGQDNPDTLSDSQKDDIEFWKEQEVTFVDTPVVHVISNIIESEHCVLIIGEPGIGKSMLLHNVALKLQKKIDYNIVPCSGMQDMLQQYKEGKRQMFVLDDICGQFTVSMLKIEQWMNDENKLRRIMNKGCTKVAATCRLDIYNNEKFQRSYTVFKPNIFNLSDEYSREDKLAICNKYLSQTNIQLLKDQNVDFTPLMCYLYSKNENFNLTDFLESPFEIYQKEWDKLETFDEDKYCSLFLCVIYNGVMNKSLFETYNENNKKNKFVWKIIFDVCKIDRSTSRSKIDSVMESLIGTYLKKTKNEYKVIHDQMFDFMCCYFGNKDTMVKCILRYSDIRVFNQRTQLESINEQHGKFTIMISKKHEKEYFERIKSDLQLGKINQCFYNTQMKYEVYRTSFLKILNSIDDKLLTAQFYQRKRNRVKVRHADYIECDDFSDDNDNDVNDKYSIEGPFIKACLRGYYDIAQYFISKSVDRKSCDSIHSPLTAACKGGNEKIVQLLIDKESDVNQVDGRGCTPLNAACKGGNEKIVQLLLNKGSDVNRLDGSGCTPLTAAGVRGNEKIVQLLIDKGSDVNQGDGMRQTPLTAACSGGNEKIVEILIDKGIDINQIGNCGHTPLTAACRKGNKTIVQLLIDKGSDVNQEDGFKQKPLTSACIEGHQDIVQLLLEKESDYNYVDSWKYTPLTDACRRGNEKIVHLLIDKGSDVNKVKNARHTPLTSACHGGNEKLLQLLIDRGCDVNQGDNDGETPLIVACGRGCLKIAQFLIGKGSKVNQKGGYGKTPLTSACSGEHEDIVKLLIDKGSEVNCDDMWNDTPLTTACRKGNVKIVQLLIDKGCKVNQLNREDQTPLSAACRIGNENIVQLLIDKESDVNQVDRMKQTPLTAACRRGNEKIVQLLIENGSEVNKADDIGETPLIAACCEENYKLVQFLIVKGGDIKKVEGTKQTPLTAACSRENEKIVKFLIKKGCDVNQVDDMKQTPLTAACGRGNENIVELLIEKGCDVNQVDDMKQTPLMAACRRGNEKIVKLLLDARCDTNKTNDIGQTPLSISRKTGNKKILQLLLDI